MAARVEGTPRGGMAGGAITMRRIAVIKGLFLMAGFLSFLLSVTLWFSGNQDQGLFVGIWVPSMWSLGALMLAGEKSRS